MSNPTIPYTSIPGTKACANQLNENFQTMANTIEETKITFNEDMTETKQELIDDVEGKLDTKSIRCVRAIQFGTLNEQELAEETTILENIEDEIKKLREELTQLKNV